MIPIFDCTDYRDLLKSYYEERKASLPLFSYQMYGSKLGINASQLFHVLEKVRHLPVRCAPAAKELLGLTGRASEYFDLLLAASRTRTPHKRDELLNKAFMLRDIRRRDLEAKELKYLRQWWTVVIRSFLEVNQGNSDPKAIAQSIIPPITEEQARESIELLKSLGFVKRITSGRLALTDPHLTIGGPEKSRAIREFQAQVMQIGAQSLETISPEERDISTLTMAIDSECVQDIKGMMKEFRRQLQSRIEESSKTNVVMQLNLAFFPVAKPRKGKA